MGKNVSNNDFVLKIKSLVGDEYTFLERYDGALNKIKCQHNICNNIWYIRPNDFFNGHRCPKCSKRKPKIRDENFKKRVFNEVGDEYTFLENYKGSLVKILCKHNICNYEWLINPSDFLNNKARCPKCKKVYKRTTEDFKKEILNITNREYEVLGDFSTTKQNILFKHNICGNSFMAKPNNFLAGTRCPICKSKSKGEDKIRMFLTKQKVFFETQKIFKWSKRKIYDFFLPDFNLLIEYNGIQHYEEVKFFQKSLEYQQKVDKLKEGLAKENNFNYLIIPYWEFDNIEYILSQTLKL